MGGRSGRSGVRERVDAFSVVADDVLEIFVGVDAVGQSAHTADFQSHLGAALGEAEDAEAGVRALLGVVAGAESGGDALECGETGLGSLAQEELRSPLEVGAARSKRQWFPT